MNDTNEDEANDSHGVAPELRRVLVENGYALARLLPSGEIAALRNMMYTCGLFVGLDASGYRTRFCYPDALAASFALLRWDGHGDPPGNWIKEKGERERTNPNHTPTLRGVRITIKQ